MAGMALALVVGALSVVQPVLGALLVAVVVFAYLVLMAPRFSFLVLLFARFATDLLGGGSESGGSIATALVTAGSIAFVALLWTRTPRLHHLTPLVLVFGIYVAWLAYRSSGQPTDVGIGEALRWLSFASLALAAGKLFGDRATMLYRAVLAGGVFQAVLAAVQSLAGLTLVYATAGAVYERAAGTFKHPVWLAYFLVLCLFIVPLAEIPSRWVQRTVYVALGVGLVLTYSRGPLVFAVLVWGLLAMIQRRPRTIAAGVLAILAVLSVPAVRDRFTSELSGGKLQGSYESRLLLRDEALESFRQSPLTGNGTGYFFATRSVEVFRTPIEAHSDHLWALADTGLVGLALYLGVFGLVLQRLWRHRSTQAGGIAVSLVLAFLIWGDVEPFHRIVSVQAFAWAVIGAALAAHQPRRSSFQNRILNSPANTGIRVQEPVTHQASRR